MIANVNQVVHPMVLTDSVAPPYLNTERTVQNPYYSLLEADARHNYLNIHPGRRSAFKSFVKRLHEKGALDYDDHVEMLRGRGLRGQELNLTANSMEVMAENAYRIGEGLVRPWIQNESMIHQLNEETITTNIAAFTRYSMGLVASIFPRTLSMELFSNQPISYPTALVFYKKFIRKSGDNAGEDISDATYKTSTYASAQYPADTETLTTYVKEVGVTVTQETVTAKVRKLKWAASIESVMSLQAYHGMSMESLNDDALRTELALETDQALFSEVLDNDGIFSSTWDPTRGGTYDDLSPSEQEAWDKKLYDAITDAQTSITGARYVDRNRIWIAGNSAAIGRLIKVGEKFFNKAPGNNDGTISRGSLAGTLVGGNKVYEVPWMTDDTFLMGYKSMEFADAGFIYAPFVPFFIGPVQWDDSMNFVVKKGGLTWYATKMVVPEMFAKLTITSS